MKGIVLCYRDADAGATANDLILRADVVFAGADVPDGVAMGTGAQGNGVPINLSLSGMTQASYSNAVEDAMIAEAARLGLPVLNRTDVLLPAYTRGA